MAPSALKARIGPSPKMSGGVPVPSVALGGCAHGLGLHPKGVRDMAPSALKARVSPVVAATVKLGECPQMGVSCALKARVICGVPAACDIGTWWVRKLSTALLHPASNRALKNGETGKTTANLALSRLSIQQCTATAGLPGLSLQAEN